MQEIPRVFESAVVDILDDLLQPEEGLFWSGDSEKILN
jgi:hypothetical protein